MLCSCLDVTGGNTQLSLKVTFQLWIDCKLGISIIWSVRSGMMLKMINSHSYLLFSSIISSLQTCSRVLLPPQEKKHFLDQLSRPAVSSLMKKGLKKKIVEKCKKISHCPYCEALNGKYSWTLLFWTQTHFPQVCICVFSHLLSAVLCSLFRYFELTFVSLGLKSTHLFWTPLVEKINTIMTSNHVSWNAKILLKFIDN